MAGEKIYNDGGYASVLDPIEQAATRTAYEWLGRLATEEFIEKPNDDSSHDLAVAFYNNEPLPKRAVTAFLLKKHIVMTAVLRFPDQTPQNYNPHTSLTFSARNGQILFYRQTAPYYTAWVSS